MIQTIEPVFPNEIAMNIFKFCRHPLAQIIKDSCREYYHHGYETNVRDFEDGEYFVLQIRGDRTEEWWDELIPRLRWEDEERERDIERKKKIHKLARCTNMIIISWMLKQMTI